MKRIIKYVIMAMGILTLAFVILKLTNIISLSWWYIFLPLYILIILYSVIILMISIWAYIINWYDNKDNKWLFRG